MFAFMIMLPSVLLSGFMFPRSEMPPIIHAITYAIPVTYFIEVLRGVVLRGSDFLDLIPSVVGLGICTVVILALSIARFRKQLEWYGRSRSALRYGNLLFSCPTAVDAASSDYSRRS